jgi:hypothetical protein
MNRQSREQEIEQVRQELENLLTRYAAIQQAARWAKNSAILFLLALLLLVLFGIIVGPGKLAVLAASMLAVSILVAYGLRNARWMDVVSMGKLSIYATGPTEAMAVEDMIEERRTRLSKLIGADI